MDWTVGLPMADDVDHLLGVVVVVGAGLINVGLCVNDEDLDSRGSGAVVVAVVVAVVLSVVITVSVPG